MHKFDWFLIIDTPGLFFKNKKQNALWQKKKMTKIMCHHSKFVAGQILLSFGKCQKRDVAVHNRVFFVLHAITCIQSVVLEAAVHVGKLDAAPRKQAKILNVSVIVLKLAA